VQEEVLLNFSGEQQAPAIFETLISLALFRLETLLLLAKP